MTDDGLARGGSIDEETVEGFGYEWTKFDQSAVDPSELEYLFRHYFALFPWESLPPQPRGSISAPGAAVGPVSPASAPGPSCASTPAPMPSRWRGGTRRGAQPSWLLPVPFRSSRPAWTFGYSLGVLHHIPDPLSGLANAVAALKPGAPFLVYLYYAFDNRPGWFRATWRATDVLRRALSRCPAPVRYGLSGVLAATVYLPLATLARLLERRDRDVTGLPLSSYRNRSFYVMRTDALDRFGTRLKKRFSRAEVADLMASAGLDRVVVSDERPYWCAVGFKPTA